MIAPGPQPFHPYGDAVGFWPQTPLEKQESESASHPEFPPSKKNRHSENEPSNLFQNTLLNTEMPPPNNPPVIKGISRMFIKTRFCEKFRLGTCPYGNNCNFAHGVEEIRKPPSNWKEIVAAHEDDRGVRNWTEQQRIINRLRICRKYFYGEGCPYGDDCNFLHEDPEMLRESAAVMICSNEDSLDHRESNGVVNSVQDNKTSDGIVISVMDNKASSGVVNSTLDNKPVYWKTKICNKWEMTNYCPFGEKCHFAHGVGELLKFGGGHAEADRGKVGVAPSKPLPVPANYISPIKPAASSCKPQTRGVKRFAKWSGPELISRVYADWIDDLQPLDS